MSDDLKNKLIGKWMIDIEKTYAHNPTFKKGIEEKDRMVLNLIDVFKNRLFVEFTPEGQQIFTSVTVPSLEPIDLVENYKIVSVKEDVIHLLVEDNKRQTENSSIEFLENGDVVWKSKAEPTGRYLQKVQ